MSKSKTESSKHVESKNIITKKEISTFKEFNFSAKNIVTSLQIFCQEFDKKAWERL